MTDTTQVTAVAAAPRGAGRARLRIVWWPGLVVALGAAVATAHGLFEVASAARVPGGIAWLYPLITDGLALVAYAATARLTGKPARYAWTVVIIAAGLSGLAQAVYLASDSTVTAPAMLRFGVGAWPAVAAAVVAHLLYLLAATSPIETEIIGARPRGDRPVESERSAGAVQSPVVRPAPSTPAPVQPDPFGAEPTDSPGPLAERPFGPGSSLAGRPASDRAHTTALRLARRAGAWPTVSVLEAEAAVGRGTAATVLKALRDQPLCPHLITTEALTAPATPDQDPDDEQDTQP